MKPINLVEQYLTDLRLHGLQEGLSPRLKEAQSAELPYEDFLNLCLFDETQFRKNARIERLLRAAAFRAHVSLEGLDTTTSRGLDKKMIHELASTRFIDNGSNLLIMGPTGVGKTFLACAIGNAACRAGRSTLFFRMNNLAEKLLLSRAQNNYLLLLKKLAAVELLILDDFGIKPFTPQQFQDLYDVLDERTENKSTILTTQLPVENWSEVIADPVVCEAITDRIVPRAILLTMKGDSFRKKNMKTIDSN
jgi:DNA replication protein DnaC